MVSIVWSNWEYCYLPLDEMLVHLGVTPQQYVPGTHLYTWVKRDNVGQSILSKEATQWQGLGVEPPTFRTEVQRANHYTTALPLGNWRGWPKEGCLWAGCMVGKITRKIGEWSQVRVAHFILFPRLVTIIVLRYFPLPGVCSQATKTVPLPPAFTPPRAITQLSGLLLAPQWIPTADLVSLQQSQRILVADSMNPHSRYTVTVIKILGEGPP